MLRELDFVCPEDGATASHPVILLSAENAEVTVLVEGVAVTKTKKLEEGLLLWGISHFVFNQKTKKRTRNTNWLIRRHVLDMTPDDTPDDSVRRDIEALL